MGGWVVREGRRVGVVGVVWVVWVAEKCEKV